MRAATRRKCAILRNFRHLRLIKWKVHVQCPSLFPSAVQQPSRIGGDANDSLRIPPHAKSISAFRAQDQRRPQRNNPKRASDMTELPGALMFWMVQWLKLQLIW